MTHLQLYLFGGQNGTSLCDCSFTYWCHWVHVVYGNNINVSKNWLHLMYEKDINEKNNTFPLNTSISVYY